MDRPRGSRGSGNKVPRTASSPHPLEPTRIGYRVSLYCVVWQPMEQLYIVYIDDDGEIIIEHPPNREK